MILKKCPICEFNFIRESEECCSVCAANEIRQKERLEENTQFKGELLNKFNSYNFIGFLHTTNLSNFVKIYEDGFLFSREYMMQNNIKFEDNAMPEVINITNEFVKHNVRFYYRIKTPTNYRAYHSYNQSNPVLLVFDKKIIFDDDVAFSDGCAASNKSTITKNAETAINFKWEDIFSQTPLTEEEVIMNMMGNGPTRYRNAEFLYPIKISIDKVNKIYFKNKADMDYAVNILGVDDRFEVNALMFC